MRVLVTGGSGFLGTNLVEHLRQQHAVLNFDAARPIHPGHEEFWAEGDITNASEVYAAYQSFAPEVVFHLAARTDLHGTSLEDYSANTVGVENVINAGRQSSRELRTIYASSRLVFAIDHKPAHTFDYKPSTFYGQSKVISERLILEHGSTAGTWSIVRPTSIWGPWFGIPYRDFFDTVRAKRYVKIRGFDPYKSYGYVGNAVHELVAFANAEVAEIDRRVFWLTDYPPLKLSEWADLIADDFDVRRPRTVPLSLLRFIAWAGDWAQRAGYQEPPLTSFRLKNLLTEMVYDSSDTSAIVGPLPFSLEQGVQETVRWMKSEGKR